MAVKEVSFNVHGHRVEAAAYGAEWLKDGDYLYFGQDLDVSMRWVNATSILQMLPVSDGGAALQIGDGTTDMDVKIFLGAAADYIEFDVSEGRLNVVSAEVRFAATAKLEFRDAAIYIQSSLDGRLDIVADQYIHITCGAGYGVMVSDRMYIGAPGVSDNRLFFGSAGYLRAANDAQLDIIGVGTGQYALTLQVTEGGSIYLSGYLGLKVTDTDGDSEGELWYDNSENVPKFYNGTAVRTVCDMEGAQIFSGEKLLGGGTKLGFRAMDCYINSDGVDRIDVHSAGDINLLTGSSIGHVGVYGFILLSPTTSVGDTEGQFWYDSTTKKLHFWNGTAEKEVTSS